MSQSKRAIQYGCCQQALYVRFEGEATSDACRAADRLVRDYLDAHAAAARLVFDLSDCRWVDSTFAGWMVGLSKRLRGRSCGPAASAGVDVAGWSEACRESLARMHLDSLFKPAPVAPPAHLRTLDVLAGEAPDRAALELMAAAHRELAGVDEENQAVFGRIADMLEQKLRSLG